MKNRLKVSIRKSIAFILSICTVLSLDCMSVFASDGVIETAGAMDTIMKLYEERSFNYPTGHGWAAERGNNLAEKVRGVNTSVVGDDNLKNGADRRIIGTDGTEINIQDKYCKSASESVNAAFDNETGLYRYLNGKW